MLHEVIEVIAENEFGTLFRFQQGKPKKYLSHLPIYFRINVRIFL